MNGTDGLGQEPQQRVRGTMRRASLGRIGAGILGLGLALLVAGVALAGSGVTGWPTGSGAPTSSPGPGFWTGMGPGMMGGGYMMGGAAVGDMSQDMGSVLAGRVGQPISQAAATALGAATPIGATVDRAANRITFTTGDVHLAVLASPPDGQDLTFRIAGLVNPTIVVPLDAQVSVQLINADPDMSHNWAVVDAQARFPYMSMMQAPAFAGAWSAPLGDPTSSGLPSETIAFTADQAGSYTYLCQVPGHAAGGMYGSFEVTGA